MTLSAPVTEEAQVDRLVGAVEGAVKELLG
jgi:hypothetical protein